MAILAASLVVLRHEFDVLAPHRDRRSDGWIGDAAHQAEQSDHNPDARGVVHAIDVDKDGVDMARCVAAVLGDARLHYVIYNRKIWSGDWQWGARVYTGLNPHVDHAHFSIKYSPRAESDIGAWGVAKLGKPAPTKAIIPRPGTRVLTVTSPAMHGDDVLFVQRWIGAAHAGQADGIYGAKTRAGVLWYQKMRGITATGKVDKPTWRQMGV